MPQDASRPTRGPVLAHGISPQVESSRREVYAESGSQVTQLTSAAYLHTHIYPESPVFTPDSRRFVYARFSAIDQPRQDWICDLTNTQLRPLTLPGEAASVHGPVVTPDGRWFVYASVPAEAAATGQPVIEIRRRSLDRPGAPSEPVCSIAGFRRPYSLGTISPDGRYYATSALTKFGEGRPPIAGILVADLETGTLRCVHEGADIFNAHVQLDPGRGDDLLVQHNRDGILDELGTIVLLVGEIGATFYLIDRDGGNLRRLNIGKPYSAPVQGHQLWLGPTGRILSTLVRRPGDDLSVPNLVTIGTGEERPTPVPVDRPWHFSHVGCTGDGRYFVCDSVPDGRIVVGSVRTGKTRVICESKSSFGRPQYTHPHPFFSPDARHVLFNSDRTGLAQIYAATVPEGFLASLD